MGASLFRAGVVRRSTVAEPGAERVRVVGEAPFLEDRQRHGPHAALGAARRETLRVQPGLEVVRCRIGGDRPLEQLPLDRQADRVRGGVALAPLATALRGVERREQLATYVTRTARQVVAHADARRASSAHAGVAGRSNPRSSAATSRWTVIRSSSRIAQGASGRTVFTALRYPLHVLQTSTLRVWSPPSSVRSPSCSCPVSSQNTQRSVGIAQPLPQRPQRSRRWRSRPVYSATTGHAPHSGQYPSHQEAGSSPASARPQAGSRGNAAICPTTRNACGLAPTVAPSASTRAS